MVLDAGTSIACNNKEAVTAEVLTAAQSCSSDHAFSITYILPAYLPIYLFMEPSREAWQLSWKGAKAAPFASPRNPAREGI